MSQIYFAYVEHALKSVNVVVYVSVKILFETSIYDGFYPVVRAVVSAITEYTF